MLQQKRSMMLSFDCRKGLAQKKKETLIIAQQEYPDEFQQQHSKKKRIRKNSNLNRLFADGPGMPSNRRPTNPCTRRTLCLQKR